MSYSLILLPSVAEELTRTLHEWQEQFDAGRALLAELVMVFGKIRERPLRYPVVYADVHRALTTRFHFAIFFEVVQERTEVIVLAALHQWRHRGEIQRSGPRASLMRRRQAAGPARR